MSIPKRVQRPTIEQLRLFAKSRAEQLRQRESRLARRLLRAGGVAELVREAFVSGRRQEQGEDRQVRLAALVDAAETCMASAHQSGVEAGLRAGENGT